MGQIILNGGIALGFYELAEQEECLSISDKFELDRLRNLSPNRIEENGKQILVEETKSALSNQTIQLILKPITQ